MLPKDSVKPEINVPIKMRDGIILYADVYKPDTKSRYPAILIRIGDKNMARAMSGYSYINAQRLAQAGYAVLFQSQRGSGGSDGEVCWRTEPEDGYDTIEWIATQPWCDGNVGMLGLSHMGHAQWRAALSQPPHLKVICPAMCSGADWGGPLFKNGVPRLSLMQHPDGPSVMESEQWAHIEDDEYWKRLPSPIPLEKVIIPAFHMSGWYDYHVGDVLASYKAMKERGGSELARKNQKVLVGPWPHGPLSNIVGEVDFGKAAAGENVDVTGIYIRWYDYWLKGIDNGIMDEPPVRIFVMGDNVWRNENEWPLARTRYTKYYFHSGSHANSRFGDGVLSTKPPREEQIDNYLYDPKNPVPTKGGTIIFSTATPVPQLQDQEEVEKRSDVLVYTSAPLENDIEITGPIEIKLWAASSAVDTDFTGKLVDVWPNGKAYNLVDGIVRARYHKSVSKPKLIEPGKVYEYSIDLRATSNVFKVGHSIRVQISSSNFPAWDRNLNTGHPIGQDTEMNTAAQKIYHNKQYPSHIILPVIPDNKDNIA